MDPQAIFDNYRRVVTQHYFDMAGRVGRPEFWYFMLANFACYIIAAILQRITFLPLAGLYGLAMLLPVAGMGARRLQDTGKDGKLVWIFVFAGFIYWVLALMTMLSFFAVGLLSLGIRHQVHINTGGHPLAGIICEIPTGAITR